ncbi:MAG: OmpH family outer membrane protein [Candidatus Gastranaerophilaceae bacterium]
MKKLLLSLGLLTVMAMPACAEKYATVNVDYAMSKFPAAQQATDTLRQEEIKIQKFVLNARQDLEKTPAAQKKAKEDKYNKDLQAMALNLKKLEEAKGKAIYAQFNTAVQSVAKAGNYSLVVPVALYGATDITEDVIKALNKK